RAQTGSGEDLADQAHHAQGGRRNRAAEAADGHRVGAQGVSEAPGRATTPYTHGSGGGVPIVSRTRSPGAVEESCMAPLDRTSSVVGPGLMVPMCQGNLQRP